MAERMKLAITEVKDKEMVGQNKDIPKLSFKAKDGNWYACFTQKLFDLIKKDTEIDAEVEVSVKGEYTNRKITQIYQNGEPVNQRKQFGGGKSIEATLAELDSKARNTALMQACEVVKPTEVITILEVADKFYNWLKGNGVAHPTTPPPASPAKPATEAVKPNPAKEAENLFEKPVTEAVKGLPSNIQELLTKVSAHGKVYGKSWLIRTCGLTEDQLTKDPAMCYQTAKNLMDWKD